jgi:hypothetical protein
MNANEFRRIALGMRDTAEGAHMNHPDFRVHGKIFATLHHDMKWGMVALTPDQQKEFLREDPGAFVPENGAWGRMGCTKVHLALADQDTVGRAMTLARQNVVSKRETRKVRKPATRKRAR